MPERPSHRPGQQPKRKPIWSDSNLNEVDKWTLNETQKRRIKIDIQKQSKDIHKKNRLNYWRGRWGETQRKNAKKAMLVIRRAASPQIKSIKNLSSIREHIEKHPIEYPNSGKSLKASIDTLIKRIKKS